MICESCGMEMKTAQDHGAKDFNNKYCKHCTDEKGNLKNKKEIREGWVRFIMKSDKKTRKQAEKVVDAEMLKMPAWNQS